MPVDAALPLTMPMPDGRVLSFRVDPKGTAPACIALGVRKSGSSIFSSIVNALADFNGVPTIDLAGTLFEQGYRYADWNKHDRLVDLLWRGNAYIGFRDPPTVLYGDPIFKEARKILLVRDPRDALVSEYFSNAFSHSLPSRADGVSSVIELERARALRTDVESYVLDRVDQLNRTVTGYRRLLGDPNLLVLRYEDVIFDKAGWIRRIAEHFGWQASEELIRNILGWADVRPDAENPTAFVRRVAPGDHLDKLSPDAIATVDRQLHGVWADLGYTDG